MSAATTHEADLETRARELAAAFFGEGSPSDEKLSLQISHLIHSKKGDRCRHYTFDIDEQLVTVTVEEVYST